MPGCFVRISRGVFAAMLPAWIAVWIAAPAWADTLRVGKAMPNAFAFTPVDIGIARGTWAAHGLDVQELDFTSDAKLAQALVSHSLDISLGSGPAMAYLLKGVPAKAVGVIANQPLSMGLTVAANSPIRSPQDLKGARISISSTASLTDWLVRQLSRTMGWGPEGIARVALGGNQAQAAALEAGQTDGAVMSSSIGYELEAAGRGRVLLQFGDYITHFHTHVIVASDDVLQAHPDEVRRFLAGWREVITFMAANKPETVALARKVEGLSQTIEEREYDTVMPMMSRDLRFDPKALEVLAASFVDLGLLPEQPDMRSTYTEQYLPAAE